MPEFLEADGVLPELIVLRVGRTEHHVDAVEQNTTESAPPPSASLGQEDEVVHVDVRLPEGAFATVLDAGWLPLGGWRTA